MSVLTPLFEMGVSVHLTDHGKLRLSGRKPNPEAIEYAKTHRQDIIAELSKAGFPPECPFVTKGTCPPGCRFETKFFWRMVRRGVLPNPDGGCPLRHVCGLQTVEHNEAQTV